MSVFMSTDTADDGSIVINFDEVDLYGNVSVTGGYIQIRHEDGIVSITAFDKDGNVMQSDTHIEEEFV